MAVQFPAFCPNCGLIFQSNLLAIEGAVTNLVLQNNREQCPRCGARAELPDGTFDVVEDTIRVLSASRLTKARLLRLSAILDKAREGEMSPTDAAEAVVNQEPSLKPLVERMQPIMRRAFIVFLWAVIQILIAQGVSELRDDSASRQDVRQAVTDAVKYCEQHRP